MQEVKTHDVLADRITTMLYQFVGEPLKPKTLQGIRDAIYSIVYDTFQYTPEFTPLMMKYVTNEHFKSIRVNSEQETIEGMILMNNIELSSFSSAEFEVLYSLFHESSLKTVMEQERSRRTNG